MARRTHVLPLAMAFLVAGCGVSATASPVSPPSIPGAQFSCPVQMMPLVPPGNRLTRVSVDAEEGFDRVTFSFGQGSTGSGARPGAIVRPAEPPFVEGASGLPLAVEGERFIELMFRDMVVADEQGSPTYVGRTPIVPGTPAVQEVVQAEAFEGVAAWLIGVRAPGCARVTNDMSGRRLLIDVQHP